MAGVDVSSGKRGGRKSLDSEINMVPMIDLLMVTISFLLITAVWVSSARLEANANVAGPIESPPCDEPGACKDQRLHVETKDPSKFTLAWREGGAVVRSVDVPREREPRKGGLAYPALASKIAEEHRSAGHHRDPTDARFDRAVVHAPHDMPYRELIAVMDAVAQPKRALRSSGGKTSDAPAFEITFATD